MLSEHKLSRWAGATYLVVVLTGLFSLAYVPAQLNVPDDPAATIANILAAQPLFRLGIALYLVKQLAFLLLPLLLYRLFRPVNATLSVLMVALAVSSVPVALAALGHRLDVLSLLTEPYFVRALEPGARTTQAWLALTAYRNVLFITTLLWGAWLLPFGALVFKSGFLPRVFGVLLILGGLGYFLDVFCELLLTGYGDSAIARYMLLPAAAGEIGICLWLLLVGTRPRGALAATPATP